MFCCTLFYVPSSFAIILMGKRELVALLSLSSWCLVIVVWLFLAVPWVCLQFVIVIFPDHTHLLFTIRQVRNKASVRNRYNQNHTIWESDKTQENISYKESQEVSPFPAGKSR